MTASRLLKSWAMPPASRPMLSSFWAWSRRASSAVRSSRSRRAWVTSWTRATACIGAPSASRINDTLTSAHTVRPVAWRNRSSPANPVSASPRSASTGNAMRASSSACSTSENRRPTRSWAAWPSMSHIARLTRRTAPGCAPPASMSAMPIGALSKELSNSSRALRSSCAARWRRVMSSPMPAKPVTRPSASCIALLVISSGMRVPSARSRTKSARKVSPATRRSRRSSGCTRPSSALSSATGRPSTCSAGRS